MSRALRLQRCTANYQNSASAAELFSESSAERFSFWVVQRIISRAHQLLSCTANYQQSTSAAELYSELSAEHFSCWVVQRTIRRALQLTPVFSLQTECWGSPLDSPVCRRAVNTGSTLYAVLFPPCFLAARQTQFSFGCMPHSEHPWVFLSSEGNLSSSEP